MIHQAYIVSEVARRYYKLKTGEELTNEQARNRWKMTRNPDPSILKKVMSQITTEQKKML